MVSVMPRFVWFLRRNFHLGLTYEHQYSGAINFVSCHSFDERTRFTVVDTHTLLRAGRSITSKRARVIFAHLSRE